MPLDPSQVQWDAVDPGKVKWDSATDDSRKKLAQETGAGSAALIGAGAMGDRLWEGLKQGGMGMGAILSELLPDRLKRAAQDALAEKLMAQEKRVNADKAEYKNLEEAHPIATALGEAAPIAAAPMLRVAGGAGALPAAVNAAASSALPAALEYGTAGERGARAGIAGAGGAIGSGITSAISKVAGGVANVLTPEARRLAALAEDKFNIPLDAAQKTGNKALQTIDAVMETMPVTSGAQAIKKTAQRDAFTREVMKTIGEAADEATPATLTAAQKRIGGDFERIFSKTHVKLDDEAVQANLGKAVQDAIDALPQDTAALVVKRAGQIIDKVDDNGDVAGKAYQAWRSQVQKQAQETGDRTLATHLRAVYRAVDDAAYKGAASVGEDTALQTARQQYRNMKIIEPLIAKSEDGTLSPALLRGAVMNNVKDFASGGGGDLAELAKIGRAFVSDKVPNSGTAQRGMAQALLTGGTMGGLGWAASGDPVTGAKMAAGGLILPKVAQTVLNSPGAQRLLTSGRALSPLEQALIDRAARLGVLGTANELSR
jgi:hypothetical protein